MNFDASDESFVSGKPYPLSYGPPEKSRCATAARVDTYTTVDAERRILKAELSLFFPRLLKRPCPRCATTSP